MLRRKPILAYSGLTIVLQNPSRMDNFSLLSGNGGVLVNDLLQQEFNLMQCDVRLADDTSPWLANTRAIILCGEYAMHKYLFECRNNVLNEMRGSPFYIDKIPTVCSFFPQDCVDRTSLEQKYNEGSHDYTGTEEDDDDEDEAAVKRFSRTKRSNFSFWLRQDIRKVKNLLRQNSKEVCRWPIEEEPTYKIYPPADEVINTLNKYENHFLEFDMETDIEERNMLCFSFSFWDGKSDKLSCPVFGVPILDYEYKYAYSNVFRIIIALVKAIERNIIVAHNGHGFDYLVLALKYKIAIRKCYDTMVAMQRIYPDIERSLGHLTSLWTHQKFHKDTSAFAYRTREHMINHLKYCCKDVFTMWLSHKAMQSFSHTVPGLVQSIDCAQKSLRPYITSTVQGIRYDTAKVEVLKNENDRLMMQYIRIIDMLVGPSGMEETKKAVKKATGAFPSSNKRLADYFHRQLDYPVIFRGEGGNPLLGKKSLFRMALKHDNATIMFINLYRTVAKEYSALKFNPFKDDNNQLINHNGQA